MTPLMPSLPANIASTCSQLPTRHAWFNKRIAITRTSWAAIVLQNSSSIGFAQHNESALPVKNSLHPLHASLWLLLLRCKRSSDLAFLDHLILIKNVLLCTVMFCCGSGCTLFSWSAHFCLDDLFFGFDATSPHNTTFSILQHSHVSNTALSFRLVAVKLTAGAFGCACSQHGILNLLFFSCCFFEWWPCLSSCSDFCFKNKSCHLCFGSVKEVFMTLWTFCNAHSHKFCCCSFAHLKNSSCCASQPQHVSLDSFLLSFLELLSWNFFLVATHSFNFSSHCEWCGIVHLTQSLRWDFLRKRKSRNFLSSSRKWGIPKNSWSSSEFLSSS